MASVGIDAICTPAGKRTRTGVPTECLVVPSPSWPCVPRPQAKRLPSASSAYCVEFDVPTSATGPGKVTIAGDRRTATSNDLPAALLARPEARLIQTQGVG